MPTAPAGGPILSSAPAVLRVSRNAAGYNAAGYNAVAKTAAELGQPGIGAVTVRGVSGVPSEELIRASAGAELLVVGARGMGGMRRMLLGSVSSTVMHHARCPVVVIPDVG